LEGRATNFLAFCDDPY